MKSLENYIINEGLSNKQIELVGKLFSTMFNKTKITKEQLILLLGNLDTDVVKTISKYFNDNESENYLAYAPNEDEFLNDNLRNKINNQIAEYINKFKCN